jgi:aryl-alcohol dehydrogenase-like predicted oxidoreductase
LGNEQRWAIWEAAGLDDLLDEGEARTGFLLRFTNAHPGMNTNIVGTMNVDHLKENIAAASRPLPADTYAEAKRRLHGQGTLS